MPEQQERYPQNHEQQADTLFRLLDAHAFFIYIEPEATKQFSECWTLLLIHSGEGVLETDGCLLPLHRGQSVLLKSGQLFKLNALPGKALAVARIRFERLRYSGHRGQDRFFVQERECEWLPIGKLSGTFYYKARPLVERLCSLSEARSPLNELECHLAFHQLLAMLPADRHAEDSANQKEAIRRTMRYMTEHYHQPVSRDRLAAVAGMSLWHFSRKFKEATGVSPSEMLKRIRIDKAKELLLLQGKSSIREIAVLSGFQDEAYFRSRFKETVGVPPADYQTRKREKAAVLSYHYAAHMLALGITPFAAYVDPRRDGSRTRFHESISCHLRKEQHPDPSSWQQNLQLLARAEPEVILCDELIDEAVLERLREIAPLKCIPWMQLEWRQHFMEIAEFMNNRKKAEHWLRVYERRAKEVRMSVQRRQGCPRTALLHINEGKLLVYGRRNGGAVLFEDLRLPPAFEVHPSRVCREIGLQELIEGEAELMLVAIDKSAVSERLWRRLQTEPQWNRIPAVNKESLYIVPEIPWLEYASVSHLTQLEWASASLS
ncbi:helix-turn-helix domain-containing protein [Cohnella boryungensis]|uniref:Helix-turn-helix domain-containing protein n=1 Tax=Cohnella boryungensis TaxID=768479 RepID=A0ABV8SIW6_9BACL